MEKPADGARSALSAGLDAGFDEAECLKYWPFDGDYGHPSDKILKDKIGVARKGARKSMINSTLPPALAGQVEPTVRPAWVDCTHEWWALVDSMYSNEHQEDVTCAVCGCPGERTIATGEVFWPAT